MENKMNVSELKQVLEGFSDDTVVRFSYAYGDRGHTYIASEIRFVDLQPVKKSEYVNNFIIDDNEDNEFIEDENYCVVLS